MLMEMSPWWFLVAFAVFLIGLTKSGFGSGVGLLNVPMMALAMSQIPGRGTDAALGLMLPLLIAGDLIAVYQYRSIFSMKHIRTLLPGSVLGVVVGGLLLWWFKEHEALLASALIKMEIGLESIALVGLHWWRQYRGVQQKLIKEPLRGTLTGTFAGASSTLAHAAGPIIAMYLLPLKLDRRVFVGTCAIYFFLLNTAKLPVYAAGGLFENASPIFAALFLPLVVVGALVGVWLNKRMSDTLFSRVVYVLTFALGVYILIDGSFELHAYLTAGPVV